MTGAPTLYVMKSYNYSTKSVVKMMKKITPFLLQAITYNFFFQVRHPHCVEYNIPYFPAHKTHFFSPPEKCDLNSTCILCAVGKYYFQTYKYPYIYYTTSLSWDSENNHEDDFSDSDDDFLGFYDE